MATTKKTKRGARKAALKTNIVDPIDDKRLVHALIQAADDACGLLYFGDDALCDDDCECNRTRDEKRDGIIIELNETLKPFVNC